MLRRCKVIQISRTEANLMRERIARMGHPTLNEMTDPHKTVYQLMWLIGKHGEFRIERS